MLCVARLWRTSVMKLGEIEIFVRKVGCIFTACEYHWNIESMRKTGFIVNPTSSPFPSMREIRHNKMRATTESSSARLC